MPKTSVLIATRDRPVYLAEAIASIETQTDVDWELIVCDNASTDPQVGRVIGEAQDRIGERFRTERVDLGDRPAACWNHALRSARGHYCTILDDDNRKRPDFLTKMIAPLDADRTASATTCGWHKFGAGWDEDVHENLRTSYEALRMDNTVDGNALLYRRVMVLDRLGGYDESLTTSEDWHFVIRLVQSFRVVNLPDVLVDYRMHEGMRTYRAPALGRDANIRRIRAELYPAEVA